MATSKTHKQRILKKWNRRCAYCGIVLTFESCTVDHDVPSSRGGSNSIKNKVPACNKCNSTKGSLTGDEYRNGMKCVAIKNVQYAMIRQSRNLSPKANLLIPVT